MENCVITGAARTTVGTFLGSFKTVAPQYLACESIKGALERSNISGDQVDEVIFGHVMPNAE